MAQFLTLLPVLLLLAVFNPIVCPSSQLYNERRYRAPHIEPSENSPQYLSDSAGTVGSRSRKIPSYRGNIASRPNQEHLASSQPADVFRRNQPTNNYEQPATESVVDDHIRKVFSTNFGPGLHLFKNTTSFVNPPHFNPFTDQMVGDQPDPHIPPSITLPSDEDFFVVQRNPDKTLGIAFRDEQPPKDEINNKNYNLNNENVGNRFHANFPTGLPLTKDMIGPSSVNHNRSKDSIIHYPTEVPDNEQKHYTVDTNDCVENDVATNGKPFCTNLRNYPEKSHLEQIIKQRFSNLESFFGEDLVLPQNIGQRMNSEPNEEFLCKSRTRVIYPQAGLNKDYDWLIIVNIPNYKQGIRIEECINEGSPCGESSGISLPNRYTAKCKQSYIYRSLVAYTNDTVIKDQFKMPSCCKCVLKAV